MQRKLPEQMQSSSSFMGSSFYSRSSKLSFRMHTFCAPTPTVFLATGHALYMEDVLYFSPATFTGNFSSLTWDSEQREVNVGSENTRLSLNCIGSSLQDKPRLLCESSKLWMIKKPHRILSFVVSLFCFFFFKP